MTWYTQGEKATIPPGLSCFQRAREATKQGVGWEYQILKQKYESVSFSKKKSVIYFSFCPDRGSEVQFWIFLVKPENCVYDFASPNGILVYFAHTS